MPDTSNAPDPPISDFSSCPKFVPLAGVDGVRSLLRTFAAGGVLSFAAFKLCWEGSALPAILVEHDESSQSGSASGEPTPQRVGVRHLYAAAASFLAGMWGEDSASRGHCRDAVTSEDEDADKRHRLLVQTGALFTIFCLYSAQPEHDRDCVPLTPAGWQHLLELCKLAKLQKQDPTSGLPDLSDMRVAYAQLYAAGALSFCCAPAPLEADSFPRPDVRDAGVWSDGYNASTDVPSQRSAQERFVSAVEGSNALVHRLAAKSSVEALDFSELNAALVAYTQEKQKLGADNAAQLVPNYVDPDLCEGISNLAHRRPRHEPTQVSDKSRKSSKQKAADKPWHSPRPLSRHSELRALMGEGDVRGQVTCGGQQQKGKEKAPVEARTTGAGPARRARVDPVSHRPCNANTSDAAAAEMSPKSRETGGDTAAVRDKSIDHGNVRRGRGCDEDDRLALELEDELDMEDDDMHDDEEAGRESMVEAPVRDAPVEGGVAGRALDLHVAAGGREPQERGIPLHAREAACHTSKTKPSASQPRGQCGGRRSAKGYEEEDLVDLPAARQRLERAKRNFGADKSAVDSGVVAVSRRGRQPTLPRKRAGEAVVGGAESPKRPTPAGGSEGQVSNGARGQERSPTVHSKEAERCPHLPAVTAAADVSRPPASSVPAGGAGGALLGGGQDLLKRKYAELKAKRAAAKAEPVPRS